MVRVCVVGSVNSDLVFDVAALPKPGETVLAGALRSSPGGKGGNQAVAAARAGAAVTMVAAVGDDDAGALLRGHLRDNGIGLDGLVTLPVPSGRAAIIVGEDAENMIVVAPGANAHLTLDAPVLRDTVAACDVLLVQLEIPVETALAAARGARLSGATVILNASPAGTDPDALAQLAALTDVVVVNESEARDWRWPVPHLVTTRGAAGVTYVADGVCSEVAAPAVEAVDTTGAGDVFAGVLAASWDPDGGVTPHQALRRAAAAGALATLTPGAGDCAPYAEAIEDVLIGG